MTPSVPEPVDPGRQVVTTAGDRIRVLHVLDALDHPAGGERAALNLATHLDKNRFDVWFCTTRCADEGPIAELREAGVHHVDIRRRGRFDARGHLALLRVIREISPDVVHAHMYGSNVGGTIFGTAARVPVVIAHEQTWSYEGQPLRRFVDGRVIGRLADAFLAVSSADAERMQRLEGVPAGKVHMIPNAWSGRVQEARADLRAELGIPADAPVAASVMVMRPQKRLDVMVDAFARTLEQRPDARLLLVGSGPEREPVRRRVSELGLEASVFVLPYREDVGSVWRAADVLVMSSDYEGTPLSVLEGMAAGMPVVSTEVGGLPDITDGRCAVLVPRRDPAALGDAIAEVLADPVRRQAMGAAARERAAEFTADAHARRCAALYESLLART